MKVAKEIGIPKVFIHFFGDGRDTDPKSGAGYMEGLLAQIEEIGVGQISSVTGRYYAMDRDKRWERVEVGLNALCIGDGEESSDPVKTIKERYAKGENDEFLKPIIVGGKEGRIQGKLDEEHILKISLTGIRWRSSLLLQLPIRSCSRNHPTPWWLRSFSIRGLRLSQGYHPHNNDPVQVGLPIPNRFQAPTHG